MTKLQEDTYRKNRGGYSRLLKVTCEHCGQLVCYYQKDGAGPLKRMYADRIVEPQIIWKKNFKLACKKCKRWLGVGGVYDKENRKCFILFQDAVEKKVSKA